MTLTSLLAPSHGRQGRSDAPHCIPSVILPAKYSEGRLNDCATQGCCRTTLELDAHAEPAVAQVREDEAAAAVVRRLAMGGAVAETPVITFCIKNP